MPERIQRKRVKGWRMPENTVSVTRPGRYGNPFKVGASTNCKTAGDAVLLFEIFLVDHPKTSERWAQELRGKNLACFCPLDQPCHADVLLELANAPVEASDQ